MSNKYSKLKPKIKPLPFIILGLVLVLILVLVLVLRPNPKKTFFNDYEGANIPENHIFEEVSYKTLNKKAKNETMLVYIGFPNLNFNKEVEYYYLEFYNQGLDEYFDKIYYLNLAKLKGNEFEAVIQKYEAAFDGQQWKPTLIYITEGEVTLNRSDYLSEGVATAIRNFYKDVLKEFN